MKTYRYSALDVTIALVLFVAGLGACYVGLDLIGNQAAAGPVWNEGPDFSDDDDVSVHPIEMVRWIEWGGCDGDSRFYQKLSAFEHEVAGLIPEVCVLCPHENPMIRPILLYECGPGVVTWAQVRGIVDRVRGWQPLPCERATFSIVPGTLVWPCECWDVYCYDEPYLGEEDGVLELERLAQVGHVQRLILDAALEVQPVEIDP